MAAFGTREFRRLILPGEPSGEPFDEQYCEEVRPNKWILKDHHFSFAYLSLIVYAINRVPKYFYGPPPQSKEN